MAQYKTLYIKAVNDKKDPEELDRVIQLWTDDNATLHSVVPKLYEGSTEGYFVILETSEVE